MDKFLVWLLCITIAIIAFFCGIYIGDRDGYRRGQINALTGEYHYCLNDEYNWQWGEPVEDLKCGEPAEDLKCGR